MKLYIIFPVLTTTRIIVTVSNVESLSFQKEVIIIGKQMVNTRQENSQRKFRLPNVDDGADIWKLVKRTDGLDLNSSYSYFMWCSYFRDTSVVVEDDGNIIGFVSGFIQPSATDRLFIWQIVIDEKERGKGLASKMLHHLLNRPSCKDIKYIEATVSPLNLPSQNLFYGLAKKLNTDIHVSEFLITKDFPINGHEDELLYQIGPF